MTRDPSAVRSERPPHILPVLVLAQLAGTSLWFTGNAVVGDLRAALGFGPEAIGWMTSAVQLGFIAGTLAMALLAIPDRFSSRRLFLTFSLCGAAANLGLLVAESLAWVLLARFATGVCLAGIYPIGMRIAASWYREGLGRAIGYLVGAVVLGTAVPHLLRAAGAGAPWQSVVLGVSLFAALGGVVQAVLVPEGPHLRARGKLRADAIPKLFRVSGFRASAFGYFGHMWELYTFWTFVPVLLGLYAASHGAAHISVSLWSGLVIGVGGIGCAGGGLLVQHFGSARVAGVQLAASGLCCLLAPFLMGAPLPIFLGYLLLWGVVVAGDSPQFSTLNAQSAPPELVGTGLAIAVSIGFALTIASIELANVLQLWLELPVVLAFLAVGPALGLLGLRPLLRQNASGGPG